jgi:hypothetical protein
MILISTIQYDIDNHVTLSHYEQLNCEVGKK